MFVFSQVSSMLAISGRRARRTSWAEGREKDQSMPSWVKILIFHQGNATSTSALWRRRNWSRSTRYAAGL